MSDEIKSHGQRGGITAHTVNIGTVSSGSRPDQERPRWKKICGYIAAVVFFIAAIIAILEFFNLKPSPTKTSENAPVNRETIAPMKEPAKQVVVTSFNQSGGITADTVNITGTAEPLPQRLLTDSQKAVIVAALKTMPRETVLVVANNSQESQRYLSDFTKLFEDAGWKVEHFLPATSFRTVCPIRLGYHDGQDSKYAQQLSSALTSAGIDHIFDAFNGNIAQDMIFDPGIIEAKPLQAVTDKIQ